MSAIVLIGPAPVLPLLRHQLDTHSQIQSFTEHEVRQAVEYIATAKPPMVAIDEEFAVSTRGEALIGRIADDPELAACEIRILPRESRPLHDRGPVLAAADAATTDGEPPPPAIRDRQGTRRVERIRLIEGVAVTVDGSPAELIDLSTVGAQVVSRIVLRPNQQVRLSLPGGTQVLRCPSTVMWASFEMPPGQQPRYRAGLKISGVDGALLLDFAEQHRAQVSGEPD